MSILEKQKLPNNMFQIAETDDWIKRENVDFDIDDSSEPYVFALVDYQELITNEKICSYKRTIEKINDESRIEDASLYINELKDNNHYLIFHSINIIRDGQIIDVLKEEKISVNQRELALENHVTDNTYTVSFSIDDLRVGDIIDHEVSMILFAGEHPLDGKYYFERFWLNWNCSVTRQLITINNHSSKAISLQTCTMIDGLPQSKIENLEPNQTFKREFNNLETKLIEETAPVWLWHDHMLVATKSSWEEISAYLYDYYESQGLFDLDVTLEDMPDFKSEDDLSEKIIKIIRFVQNDVRYKGENYGIYSHTPKPAYLTLKNRYGDCKDKSILLVSLLKTLNVQAHLVLVNSDYGLKINTLISSPYHFNHVIVKLIHNGKEYYFDSTIKKQSGNLENSALLNYGYVLPLTKMGMSLQLVQYNLSKTVFNLKHVFDFSKNDAEENILTIHKQFYQHRADNIRYYLQSKSERVRGDEYLKYAKDETNLELQIVKPMSIITDDSDNNVIETEEVYHIKNLTDNDDEKELHLPTNLYLEFPTCTNKDHSLRIDMDGKMTHDVKVIYKCPIPHMKSDTNVSNKWFTYSDSVSTVDNILFLNAKAEPYETYVKTPYLDKYLLDVEQLRQRSMNNFYYKTCNSSIYTSLGEKFIWLSFVIFVLFFIFMR